MNMEEKPVQVLLRLLPSEVAKLDALEKGLNAKSRNHAVSILLDSIRTVQAARVEVDAAILQPPVKGQVEADGDIVFA